MGVEHCSLIQKQPCISRLLLPLPALALLLLSLDMAMVDTDMVDMAVDTMEDMDTTMARDPLMLMLSLDMAMVAMDMAVDMADTDTTMARDLLMPKPLL